MHYIYSMAHTPPSLSQFGSLMLRRIEDAKRLGCDGIEFDNPDVVIHDSKFANGGQNTLDHVIAYAKVRDLRVGLMPVY